MNSIEYIVNWYSLNTGIKPNCVRSKCGRVINDKDRRLFCSDLCFRLWVEKKTAKIIAVKSSQLKDDDSDG